MIKVKFLGGAKKSFSTDVMTLDKNGITVQDLLDILQKSKPSNTPELDEKNILIAVNGVDSSALNGKNTTLQNNDTVSLIPVIHGGSITIFPFAKIFVELFEIKPNKIQNINFLTELRKKYPDLIIQGIFAKYVLSKSHVKKILKISFEAKNNQNMLSQKLETDILMRFACTTQISQAIETAGLKPKQSSIIIALGKKSTLKKLHSELKSYTNSKTISKNNSQFLKKHFKISKKQIDSVYSKKPLEDLLVEKAAVLF
ncbi:MAG TPA: KEOPS complex subunit Cgi121 [Nitrosopumilaceae archaeon]|nr:KEOPS complex subunit Cgi121 [Nitrosopumilaceae archaeon]